MKRSALLILVFFICLGVNAQGSDSVVVSHSVSHSVSKTFTWHTKYEYCTHIRDGRVHMFDVVRENVFSNDIDYENDHRIRCVINGNDSTFFVCLHFDRDWEFIEEHDVRKLLDNMKVLMKQEQEDENNTAVPYFENWYYTEDGTRFGYVMDKTLKIRWELYHWNEEHDSEVLKKKKLPDFVKALVDDLEEIDNIRKGKITQ